MKKTSTPFYKTGVSRSPFEMHEPGHTLKQKEKSPSISNPFSGRGTNKRGEPKVRSVNEVGRELPLVADKYGGGAPIIGDSMASGHLGANQSWQGELKSSQKKEPLSEGVQKVKDRQTKRIINTLNRSKSRDQKKKDKLQKKNIRKEARKQIKSIKKNNTIL